MEKAIKLWALAAILLLVFSAAAIAKEDVLEKHSDKFRQEEKNELKKEEKPLIFKYKDPKLKIGKAEGKQLKSLLEDEAVAYIEIDQLVRPLESAPWNIVRVGASSVWDETIGTGIKVAVLDTGIGPHDDLVVAGGWNIVDNSSNYIDSYGHGTMIAGVIAAVVNGEGLVGASPDADVYAVKIMNGASGQLSDAIAGVVWAVDNDMDIVTMSFGIEGYSQLLKEALEEAYDEGILLIAAAGNDGSAVVYPAVYADVIAVGATDKQNNKADFSNYGPELELVAPGEDINSTSLDGYGLASGTSMATPHVAGVAALLMAYNNSLTNINIRSMLRNSALDLGIEGKDYEYGFGLVQTDLEASTASYEDTYYYEIYNITDHGQENETHLFWLSGNGTIDDLVFAPGYYLVTKYLPEPINQTLYVGESGSIFALEGRSVWSDYWAYHGEYDDGIVWEEYDISTEWDGTVGDLDVLCYDPDRESAFDPWKCWAGSSSELTACRNADSNLDTFCTNNPSDCYGYGLTYTHQLPSSYVASRDKKLLGVMEYYDCSGSITVDSNNNPYYIIDNKKNQCDGTEYNILGQYSSTEWEEVESLSCGAGSVCDSTQDEQTCDTSSCTPTTPCRRTEGSSCDETDGDVSNDCYTGLNCESNVCTAPTNATTDLAIVDIIPIQVIPDVDMIQGKSGYVVVEVLNNGTLTATAEVGLLFDGLKLPITTNNIPALSDGDSYSQSFVTTTNSSQIISNETKRFVFDFNPDSYGTNKALNATVKVS